MWPTPAGMTQTSPVSTSTSMPLSPPKPIRARPETQASTSCPRVWKCQYGSTLLTQVPLPAIAAEQRAGRSAVARLARQPSAPERQRQLAVRNAAVGIETEQFGAGLLSKRRPRTWQRCVTPASP